MVCGSAGRDSQVIAGDALEGLDGVEVVADDDAMYRSLVREAVSFLSPIVDTVRAHVSVGRRGLWGITLDSLLWPFAEQADDEPPAAAHARVALGAGRRSGHALRPAPRLDRVRARRAGPHRAADDIVLPRVQVAQHARIQRDDGCDPRWDTYCMLCPLIPKAESIYRARWWIDHPDGHE